MEFSSNLCFMLKIKIKNGQGLDSVLFRSTLRNPSSLWLASLWFTTPFQLVKGSACLTEYWISIFKSVYKVLWFSKSIRGITDLRFLFFWLFIDTQSSSNFSHWILRGTRIRTICLFDLKWAESASEVVNQYCINISHRLCGIVFSLITFLNQ